MDNAALLSIPIQRQQWVEIEEQPTPARLTSLFRSRQPKKKKKRHLQNQTRWHTFFGAEIPYLTNFLSLHKATDGLERRNIILQDAIAYQIEFLNRMVQMTGYNHTLELRHLFWPTRRHAEIALIGKVVGENQSQSKAAAAEFWQYLVTHYPQQIYGISPISNVETLTYFLQFQAEYITEFRRYEELAHLGRDDYGYVVYPLQGSPTSLNHFWQSLFTQTQPYLLSVCIRPTQLTQEEQSRLEGIASFCRGLKSDPIQGFNISAEDVAHIYTNYWHQFKNPFQFRLSVASPAPIHPAFLSELSASLAHSFPVNNNKRLLPNKPGHFVTPRDDYEQTLAQINLGYLELADWGEKIADPPFSRLPQLIGPTAAGSSFRIPIPPSEGLPGIDSRPLVVMNDTEQTITGNRNITGNISFTGPIYGTVVIGGDIVGFRE